MRLLGSNSRIKIDEDKILFSNASFGYTLKKEDIDDKKESFYHFSIFADNDKNISKLEDFDNLIRRINNECGKKFVIDTIWDEVSYYHIKKLYPHLVEIENLLRKLIYYFIVKSVGMNWVENAVPNEFIKSIHHNGGEKETTIEQDQLYYADFIDLRLFLFKQYYSKPIDQLYRDIKKVIDDNKPIETYKQLIKQYEPKTNWERYFSDKVEIENLEDKWNKLYGYRNQVAHARRMRKKEYDEAIALIEELKPAFIKGLSKIDDVKLTREETDFVKETAKESTIRFSPNTSIVSSGGSYIIQNDVISSEKLAFQSSLFSGLSEIQYEDGAFKIKPDLLEKVFVTMPTKKSEISSNAKLLFNPEEHKVFIYDPQCKSKVHVDASDILASIDKPEKK